MIAKVEDTHGLVHESVLEDEDDRLYYWTARTKEKGPPEIWWTACGSTTGRLVSLASLRDIRTTCLRCIANRSHDDASDRA